MGLEQWGGSAGGRIVKDKLFYFGAFENQRYDVGATQAVKAPSSQPGSPSANPSFSIPDAVAALNTYCGANPATAYCVGGAFTNNNINPISKSLLALYPSNSSTASASAPFAGDNIVNIYNAVGKVDYSLNSHHTFNGAYFFGNGTSTSFDSNSEVNTQFRALGRLRSQFVTSNWTYTPNSTWVNVVRAGWTYYNRPVFTVDHAGTA